MKETESLSQLVARLNQNLLEQNSLITPEGNQNLELVSQINSEVHQLLDQLQESQEQLQELRLLMDHSGAAIWSWNLIDGVVAVNRQWAYLLGHSSDEDTTLDEEEWSSLFHPDDRKRLENRYDSIRRGTATAFHLELRLRHWQGHWIWVTHRGQVVEWNSLGDPTRIIGKHTDITPLKQVQLELTRQRNLLEQRARRLSETNQKLNSISKIDPLTQIANRRAYEEQISRSVNLARRSYLPLSMVLLDIDYFKQYNDHYGHDAGDRVLQQCARLLQAALPRSQDFVARFGGEEFVFVLPNTRYRGAEEVAERLCQALRQAELPHAKSAISEHITVSAGFTTLTGPNLTEARLLKQADRALYLAKGNGRNQTAGFTGQENLQENPSSTPKLGFGTSD